MFNNLSTLPDLEALSNDDLMLLRDRINSKLQDLRSVDLETELLNQLVSVKELLRDVYTDDDQSASQKAALINSCTSIIKELAKTQTEIYSAERVKTMESALIQTLRETSQELITEFLNLYEKRIEEVMS